MRNLGRKVSMSFVALMVAALLLAGCAQTAQPTVAPTATEAQQATEAPTPAPAEDPLAIYDPDPNVKYTISVMTFQQWPVDMENNFVIAEWNKKYNIDFQPISYDFSTAVEILNTRIASGEFPDVLYCGGGLGQMKTYVEQKLIAPISVEILQRYCPKMLADCTKFTPDPLKYSYIDGKLYGVPNLNPDFAYLHPIIWRSDWLNNVGITKVPETIQEYEAALYAFANNDPDKNGKKDTYGLSASGFEPIFGAFGAIPTSWTDEGGKLVYGAINPGMKDALALLNKWYVDGVIDPEFITGETKQGSYWAHSNSFIDGRIGMTCHGKWYHVVKPDDAPNGTLWPVFSAAQPNGDYVYGKAPIGPDGKFGVGKDSPVFGANTVFSAKMIEKEPGKLGKILQLIEDTQTVRENWLFSTWGKEGEHYTFSEDGSVVMTEKYQDVALLNSLTGWSSAIWINPLMRIEDNKKPYQFAMNTFNYTDNYTYAKYVNTEADEKYWTDLEKLRAEAYNDIITGAKPVDYFDEFVSIWLATGGQEVLDQANAAYQK